MRSAYRNRFEAIYPPAPDGGRPSAHAFADCLALPTGNLRELGKELRADLDERDGIYGIGWWFPHPGTTRRILISDYLVMALESIEVNLIEANLHLLEAKSAGDDEHDFIARAVSYDERGDAHVSMPPRRRGTDDLPRLLRDMHVVGALRSIGSAFDCLAATVIGVLGIPQRIQRADLTGLRAWHVKRGGDLELPARSLNAPVFDTLNDAAEHPAPGWLDWTLAYRNTVVHRARPVQIASLKPEPTLHRPGSRVPHFRTTEALLAPADPRRSDVELLRSDLLPVLTEDLRSTLTGAVEQSAITCDGVAEKLLVAWRERRNQPTIVNQPREQWPEVSVAEQSSFAGFRPHSEVYNPGMYSSGPDVVQRLAAAALLGPNKGEWKNFD